MGVDCRIYVRTKDGERPDLQDGLFKGVYVRTNERGPKLATHRVDVPWRYHSGNYPNGPWPKIACVLMTLMDDPNVDTVWYTPDVYEDDEGMQFSRMELLEHTAEFLGVEL